MPNVNPDILKWARETAGLTPEEAVQKLDIKEARGVSSLDRLDALENGATAPTRPLLVKMAKQYRRSLLTFYMEEPPKKGDRGEDFRTLPDTVGMTETALVDAVVRDIRVRQGLVRASLIETDEAESLKFIGSVKRKDGVEKLVKAIVKDLGFDRSAFRRGGFPYLRGLVEHAGVFVILIDNLGSHHTTIGVEAFRGFALADDVAPFVAVNANDSKRAWSFTLVHELAHLWLGQTGVSGGTAERAIEKFCNDVASEFLLPASEIENISINQTTPFNTAIEKIYELAEKFNVSATMIAYKLHREGAFDFDRYQEFKDTFRRAYLARKDREKEKNKEKDGGPPYHMIRQHRAGKALIRLVDRMMDAGTLSTIKAGRVLGVGPKSVHPLLAQARPRHSVG